MLAREADQVGGSPVNLDRSHHINASTHYLQTGVIPFIYMNVVLYSAADG